MEEGNSNNKEIQIVKEFQNVYSPTTILGVFANAIKSPVDGRIILARGEYQAAQKPKNYSGYYYEDIKSPNDNKTIKAKIPAFLRSKLENRSIYVFKGYIEKRIAFSTIELVLVVDDILQKEENQISEEELKRYEVLQKKIEKGVRDLEAAIKESIYNNSQFRIANIYGSTGIVNKDFESGIGEAKARFVISEHRCNLHSKTEIIKKLRELNSQEFDAIAIVRGGGEKSSMAVFDEPDLGEEVIKLKPIFISALGHVVNESLADKLADKKFHLPHDYGNSLKAWVDEAVAEQAKSKSLFIEQVKKDLNKTYADQIKTKDETIKDLKKTYEEQTKTKDETIKKLQKSYEENSKQQVKIAVAEMQKNFEIIKLENARLNEQLKTASSGGGKILAWVIIAAIIGLMIGLAIANA